MKIDEVRELMSMLTGNELPDCMKMSHQPSLEPRVAFSVIWYLQEHLGIIPSHFEQCQVCHSLYDTHAGGHVVDGTDRPDDWQSNLGVTPEMLQENDGACFCSSTCEVRHWHMVACDNR